MLQLRMDFRLRCVYPTPMKAANKAKKLSRSDPGFYTTIAKMAGEKILKKKGKAYFSKLAKKSHPRAEYRGGRPKKKKQATPAES